MASVIYHIVVIHAHSYILILFISYYFVTFVFGLSSKKLPDTSK
jgi:hypothetical protein